MPRAFGTFDLVPGANVVHANATSTGTGDVKTIAAPAGAVAAFISVETNSCWLTVDGTTPTTTNGLVLPKDTVPFFLPVGHPRSIKFAASVAGNSELNVMWLA